MRRFAVAAFAVLVTAAFAAAASAAAPRLILVDQGGLKRPIVLANWDENGSLLSDSNQGRPVRKAALRNRPSFRLSFMWGPEWEDYVAQGQPLAALRSRGRSSMAASGPRSARSRRSSILGTGSSAAPDRDADPTSDHAKGTASELALASSQCRDSPRSPP
jgi:hypothetical protein